MVGIARTFNGGPKAGADSANCDLYKELFHIIFEKALKLTVRWMPSHLKGETRPVGVSELDVAANDHADDLAGIGAELVQLPNSVTTPYLFYVRQIKHIQKRLATVAMYFPNREHQRVDKPPPEIRVSKDCLLRDTSHSISVSGSRYICTACLNSFRIADPACKHWLKASCISAYEVASPHVGRPTKYNDILHVGNRSSHVSHELKIYRGLVYCSKCSARAGSNQLRNLALQCKQAGTGGLAVLKAIRDGKLPPGLTEWPCPS